jgi:hypothetical protein
MRYAARHGAVLVDPVREVQRIDGAPRRRPRSLGAEERSQWLEVLRSSKRARDWDLPDLTLMMLATAAPPGCHRGDGWTGVS